MIALLLVLLTGFAVLAAGEAVRGQCRRMLANPVVVSEPANASVAALTSDRLA